MTSVENKMSANYFENLYPPTQKKYKEKLKVTENSGRYTVPYTIVFLLNKLYNSAMKKVKRCLFEIMITTELYMDNYVNSSCGIDFCFLRTNVNNAD